MRDTFDGLLIAASEVGAGERPAAATPAVAFQVVSILYLFDIDGTLLHAHGSGRAAFDAVFAEHHGVDRCERGHPLRRQDRSGDRRRDLRRAARARRRPPARRAAFLDAYLPRLRRAARVARRARCSTASPRRSRTSARGPAWCSASRPATCAPAPRPSSPRPGSPPGSTRSAATAATRTCAPSSSRGRSSAAGRAARCAEVVVVGDTIHDIAAARACGAHGVRGRDRRRSGRRARAAPTSCSRRWPSCRRGTRGGSVDRAGRSSSERRAGRQALRVGEADVDEAGPDGDVHRRDQRLVAHRRGLGARGGDLDRGGVAEERRGLVGACSAARARSKS